MDGDSTTPEAITPDESWGEPAAVQSQPITPDESWGDPAPVQAQSVAPDESWGDPQPYQGEASATPDPQSAAGTFASAAARGAGGAVAGGIGGLAGMQSGAALGTTVGGGIGTLVGGPVGTAVGSGIGALVGGGAGLLAGGFAGGALGDKTEDWLLNKLGLDQGVLSHAQQQANAADDAHPIAAHAGNVADALLAFGVGGAGGAASRLINAGIMGATETGQEAINGDGLSPTKIALSAAGGALLGAPRGYVAGSSKAIADGVASRLLNGGEGVKPNAGRPADATPQDQAEKSDIEVANDITTTAPGVAADNPPAPEAPAGNEVGAPMSVREASKPSDPSRNYDKDSAASNGQTVTAPSEPGVNTDAIHPDISVALEAHNENTPSPVSDNASGAVPDSGAAAPSPVVAGEQGGVGPEQAPSAGANPVSERLPIETGLEDAARRKRQDAINLEAQNAQQKTRVTLPSSIDEVEASRLQREKLSQIADQRQADQQGEAFFPKPMRGQAAIDEVRERIKDMPRVKAAFEAKTPEEQAVLASKILHMNASKTGEASGGPSPRIPYKRPALESGIVAGSKGELARKQAALDAWNGAFKKYGPGGDPLDLNDKNAIVDRARAAVSEARHNNKGIDPLQAYQPREKPDEYKWLRAARKVAAKPTPANVKAFVEAHTMGGATGIHNLDERIQRDDYLPSAEEAVSQGQQQEQERVSDRPTFEKFHDPDEAGFFNDQQNEMRSWLNNLNDDDYKAVANAHPDLVSNLKTTQDPLALHNTLKDDLEAAKSATPGDKVGESVSPEDVRGIKKPILNRADLDALRMRNPDRLAPTKVEYAPASAGRVLTGDERAKAIAEMSAPRPDNPARLNEEEAAVRDPEALASNRNTLSSGVPLQGAADALTKKFRKMIGDTSGKMPLPAWLQKRVNDPFSPDASEPVRQYARDLGDRFNTMAQRATQVKSFLRINSLLAPDITHDEWNTIHNAIEDRTTRSLPDKLREAYAKAYVPLRGKYNDLMDEFIELNKTYGLGHDLPDPHVSGPSKDFLSRLKVGGHTYDSDSEIDPVVGKTLTDFASTLQARDFFALDDGTGKNRLLFHRDPDTGDLTIMRNGAPTKVKGAPAGFSGNVNDKISLNVKGTKTDFKVDHATVREIEANVKNEDGTPVKYYHDPIASTSNAIIGLAQAVDNVKMLESIKNDPQFIENTTTNKEIAKERGYSLNPTTLPQLATRKGQTLYMPHQMKWALDDLHRPGLGIDAAIPLQRGASSLARVFYTFGPAIHALNEANNWAVGRGFDWITPGGWKSLGQNGYAAIKSVNTQDELQRAIAQHGGNPMLASTLTRDLIPSILRRNGADMTQNASKWDPIAKSFGITTPDLAKAMYATSSKGMWWANDVLLTHRVLENMNLHGMNIDDAIADAHNFISDYRLPTTVGGSGTMGRLASQILADPSVSLFGRYHYGLYRSYAHMTSGLLGPNATMQQRKAAAGQLMVMGALAYMVYPMLDNLVQGITGNPGGQYARRGVSTIPHVINQIVHGEKGIESITPDIFTPSIPLNTAVQGLKNIDFRGKPIIERNDMTSPTNAVRAAAKGVDFTARNLISPYGTLANAAEAKDASPMKIAGRFAGNMVGVTLPSDASNLYLDRIQKYNNQQNKAREKRPQGLLEELTNWATR